MLQVHLATVYVHDGMIYSRQRQAPTGAVRSREIIDIDRAAAALSPSRAGMMLVYGCDYTTGCFVRQLGVSKQRLCEAVATAPDFITVNDASIVVDWPLFFVTLGNAVARCPSAPLDAEMVDREARHLAYCWTYYTGIAAETGGPSVDGRAVLDAGIDRADLLAGRGCRPLVYPCP